MNKEQQELLEEAYKNYKTCMNSNITETRWSKVEISEDGRGATGRHYTQEEFINKIKTDNEFAKKWGLKIEERELSIEERQGILEKVFPMYYMDQQFGGEDIFTRNNIPTKLITITYNDKTIESYY